MFRNGFCSFALCICTIFDQNVEKTKDANQIVQDRLHHLHDLVGSCSKHKYALFLHVGQDLKVDPFKMERATHLSMVREPLILIAQEEFEFMVKSVAEILSSSNAPKILVFQCYRDSTLYYRCSENGFEKYDFLSFILDL